MEFSDAIERFNKWNKMQSADPTVTAYDMALRNFAVYMQNTNIEAVTIDDVIRWFMLMKNLKWAQNAFLPKSAALRKFFQFYRLQGFNVLDPTLIPIARKEHKLTKTVSDEDYTRVMKQVADSKDPIARARDLTILGMFWDTGVRVGELCEMNTGNIAPDKRSALIKTEKAKHKRPFRHVYWSESTRSSLIEWLKMHPGGSAGALFVSLDRRALGHPLTTRSVQRIVKVATSGAKLPGVSCHTFRHSKAHRIIHGGGDVTDVMNILGHSNVASTSRYVEMGGEELKKRAFQLM